MSTIKEKIDEIYNIKGEIKLQLINKGYSDSEVGNMLSDFPNLIRRLNVNKDLPLWFKDSIVCWYDPHKLGLTNQQIKDGKGTFKLKDHSGNGLDMVCHNFAGEGMSGMDGYGITLFNKWSNLDVDVNILAPNKILWNITNTSDRWKFQLTYREVNQSRPVKINVDLDCTLVVDYKTDKNVLVYTKKHHLHAGNNNIVIEAATDPKVIITIIFFENLHSAKLPITIELLPQYKNGLVFDGYDDYGISINQPLLTDYTIIAKRTYIDLSNTASVFASKAEIYGNGAFITELFTPYMAGDSFGARLPIKIDYTKNIFFQTKYFYNNKEQFSPKSDYPDSDKLYLGVVREEPNALRHFKGAIYSVLLFNRTLTQEELDWVETNIMGQEYPTWLTDALVCYYDPKKQGLTNELIIKETKEKGYFTLKDFNPNPKAVDTDTLLPNGQFLDMKCYNFKGLEMSGMDGYITNFNNWRIPDIYAKGLLIKKSKIIITDYIQYSSKVGALIVLLEAKWDINIKIKISNLPNNEEIKIGSGAVGKMVLHNGINNITLHPKDLPFGIFGEKGLSKGVTIELLPQYKNALIFDGVDDYSVSSNLPILTDYTIIVERKVLEYGTTSALATKRVEYQSLGSFTFERESKTLSFGRVTDIINKQDRISYQTSLNYNNIDISKGTAKDTNFLYIGVGSSDLLSHTKLALYKILLFNRTLTDYEINYIKYNIMNDALPLPIAKYSAKGRSNDESPIYRNVLPNLMGNHDLDIQLKNFNWTLESGFNNTNYPDALVFDGVDDYGVCVNFPIFTLEDGYTVIVKRKIFKFSDTRAAVLSKRDNPNNALDGAFWFEREHDQTWNFGRQNLLTLEASDISFQTSKFYNGYKILADIDKPDTRYLVVGCGGIDYSSKTFVVNMLLYEIHIFDRDLTLDLIEFYIKNNINSNYRLPKIKQPVLEGKEVNNGTEVK